VLALMTVQRVAGSVTVLRPLNQVLPSRLVHPLLLCLLL